MKRLVVLSLAVLLALAILVFAKAQAHLNTANVADDPRIVLPPRPVFPPDDVWNKDISKDPIDFKSQTYIASMGADRPLHPDFGSFYHDAPMGIPYVVVDRDQAKVAVKFNQSDESDPGPYPIPPDAPIEGGPNGTDDRHVIVIDRDNWMLYELFAAHPQPDGSWKAASGAIWDLKKKSYGQRPERWTSADAAGLPVFAGLIRYDEVTAGTINHALRFTVPKTRRAYVVPATHFASANGDPHLPPMGLRVRLKADYDISGFPRPCQVILTALKKYGMILADNGAPWFICGAHDPRWNNDLLHELTHVKGSDFEVVVPPSQ